MTKVIGFFAYHIYMHLPWIIARRCNWMLPAVGEYIYADEQ